MLIGSDDNQRLRSADGREQGKRKKEEKADGKSAHQRVIVARFTLLRIPVMVTIYGTVSRPSEGADASAPPPLKLGPRNMASRGGSLRCGQRDICLSQGGVEVLSIGYDDRALARFIEVFGHV